MKANASKLAVGLGLGQTMHRGAFFSVIIGWYNKMLASVVREVKGHGS